MCWFFPPILWLYPAGNPLPWWLARLRSLPSPVPGTLAQKDLGALWMLSWTRGGTGAGGSAAGQGCCRARVPSGRTWRRGASGFAHLLVLTLCVFFPSPWFVGWGFPPAQPPCRQQTQTASRQPPPWHWCPMKAGWEPHVGRGAAETPFPSLSKPNPPSEQGSGAPLPPAHSRSSEAAYL